MKKISDNVCQEEREEVGKVRAKARVKENLGQFAETFVHELTHIQQHAKNYVDEEEALDREVVISDSRKPKGEVMR